MPITYFLQFKDELEAQCALAVAGIYVEPIDDSESCYKQADIDWAFDPIGIISGGGTKDSELSLDDSETPVPGPWHANYIGESLPETLEPYVLDPPPTTPYRVFAQ